MKVKIEQLFFEQALITKPLTDQAKSKSIFGREFQVGDQMFFIMVVDHKLTPEGTPEVVMTVTPVHSSEFIRLDLEYEPDSSRGLFMRGLEIPIPVLKRKSSIIIM